LTIAYSREGQVSIYAFAKDAEGNYTPKDLVETLLSVEQEENHITIRDSSRVPPPEAATVSYRIDVPLHTQLSSVISGSGKQVIVGITGPANVVSGSGDIEATWIRFGLFKASTGKGKITCTRVTQLDVETRIGNIALMEDGPSTAAVKQGTGIIEVGGARGTVNASTDKGEIHIKAVNWDDWQLTSVSGNIRVEVPTEAKFQADLLTGSGVISVWRPDMKEAEEGARHLLQTVNGGGKRIQALSRSGNISIE
jgi:DUF4097 and DUF4098 domain-containing protein YvlB